MKYLRHVFFITGILICSLQPLTAQDYIEVFQEGKNLYAATEYYEAYLRFNASRILSKNVGNKIYAKKSQDWQQKAALGIQRQREKTDSLLRVTRKLTDAFYFYNGRLALAFKDGKYGFINRQGEIEIDYLYTSATNFDEETGYARVEKGGKRYWLAADGTEYPGDQQLEKRPTIENTDAKGNKETTFIRKTLDPASYLISRESEYHKDVREGIQLFNHGSYYEAFLRFNALCVLSEIAKDDKSYAWGTQLKDTAIFEIRQLFIQAGNALAIANNIRNAFYFYEDSIALAYKDGQFYFIDKQGDAYSNLREWEQAQQFDHQGLAKVREKRRGFFIGSFRAKF